MKKTLIAATIVMLLSACANVPPKNDDAQLTAAGIEAPSIDSTVRAQDDFFHHANGKWLAGTQIPADKALWGGMYRLDDDATAALRGIIEDLQKDPKTSADPDAQKVADLYASFMDEARLEALGLKPLQETLHRIDRLRSKNELPAVIAALNRMGVTTPFESSVDPDRKDSGRYLAGLHQSGLGLPDRDYYLNTADPQMADVLGKYQLHVEAMLGMLGDKHAPKEAGEIVAFETSLATAQWSKVENRDPAKTYNKQKLHALSTLAPGFDWKNYLSEAGFTRHTDFINVAQPSYFRSFGALASRTPLPVWKAYLRWHLVAEYAPYLPKAFVEQDFAFYGTAVRGVPQNEPRWKRGVALVDESIGEALGRQYVAKCFSADSKARMQKLVGNLLAVYQEDINTLDWMSAATRQQAEAKLAKLTTKIGYPDQWRDYSALKIDAGDLVGNVMRARAFEYQRQMKHLGQPVDRKEWTMTPQTVNAYYRGDLNEIVFPAAILQPPMFRPQADDAVNYGAIGVVIGHEISHGFDDRGSQFDADGNLRNWWTDADHQQFAARTGVLADQYSHFSPVPNYPINGKLTLGENIADNAGLAIAYKAYRLSLNGKDAPVIDGLTGDQRFFLGFAQSWSVKVREAEAIRRIKTDPHSPPQFRVNVPLMNFNPFYAAFDVKPGDHMYLLPEKRVTIW